MTYDDLIMLETDSGACEVIGFVVKERDEAQAEVRRLREEREKLAAQWGLLKIELHHCQKELQRLRGFCGEMNWGYTDDGLTDLEERLEEPGQTISKPQIRDLITDLRRLKAEVRRLREQVARLEFEHWRSDRVPDDSSEM